MPARTERGKALAVYNTEDVEIGLRVLALNGGVYKAAHQQLLGEGMEIPAETLRNWATSQFVQKYADIQSDLHDKINERVAGQAMDIAARAQAIEQKLMDRLDDPEVMAEIPARDLAKSLAQVAQAKGTNVEKAALLRGQPTEIHEIRGKELTEGLRYLRRMGVIELDDEDVEEIGA